MINPEGYCRHGHTVTAYHPVFMSQYIFYFNGLQTLHGTVKPIQRHEHKKQALPKTSFGKKTHVQAGWRSQYQYNKYIGFAHPDMYGFSFFKHIARELGKCRHNTKHAGKNVYVKTVFIHRL